MAVITLHEFDANQTTALTPIETDLSTENSLKTDLAHGIQEDNIQSATVDAQIQGLYELIENASLLGGEQPVVITKV